APAGAIVTAAPDAYGVLLPERSLRAMRPGASGLVLVDGAARAYEPDLTVRGALVATIRTDAAFLAPDGTVDRRPAYLYRGTVVRRRCDPPRSPASPAASARRAPRRPHTRARTQPACACVTRGRGACRASTGVEARTA